MPLEDIIEGSSPSELEIFESLIQINPKANLVAPKININPKAVLMDDKALKAILLGTLIKRYSTLTRQNSRNLPKVTDYQKTLVELDPTITFTPPKKSESEIEEKLVKELSKPTTSQKKNTGFFKHTYAVLTWFTSARLFLLRLNRFTKLIERLPDVVGKVFRFLNLSYALEVIAHSASALHDTFRKQTDAEKTQNISHARRFWNAIRKGERPHQLANAIVWFTINLLGFILSALIGAVLNVVGFAFDAIHETIIGIRKYRKHQSLLDKFSIKVIQNLDKIKELKAGLESSRDRSHDEGTIALLEQENEKLESWRAKLFKKMNAIKWERAYEVGITILLFTAMLLLLLFPPAGIPTLVIQLAAFATGSILMGLARRVLWKPLKTLFSMLFSSSEPKVSTNNPTDANQQIQSNKNNNAAIRPSYSQILNHQPQPPRETILKEKVYTDKKVNYNNKHRRSNSEGSVSLDYKVTLFRNVQINQQPIIQQPANINKKEKALRLTKPYNSDKTGEKSRMVQFQTEQKNKNLARLNKNIVPIIVSPIKPLRIVKVK